MNQVFYHRYYSLKPSHQVESLHSSLGRDISLVQLFMIRSSTNHHCIIPDREGCYYYNPHADTIFFNSRYNSPAGPRRKVSLHSAKHLREVGSCHGNHMSRVTIARTGVSNPPS